MRNVFSGLQLRLPLADAILPVPGADLPGRFSAQASNMSHNGLKEAEIRITRCTVDYWNHGHPCWTCIVAKNRRVRFSADDSLVVETEFMDPL